MPADGTIWLEFDPSQFRAKFKGFGPTLQKSLRKRIRDAGQATIEDIKSTVESGPGSGAVGIRQGIAAGASVRIMLGKTKQGVAIVSSGRRMPAGHAPMHRAYNKDGWRHPVFGTDTWVAQEGQPFFGVVIKKHEDQFRDAVVEALNDAVRKVTG